MSDTRQVEAVAASMNDTWRGRAAAGLTWEWTCRHQPSLADETREKARAAIAAFLLWQAGQDLGEGTGDE